MPFYGLQPPGLDGQGAPLTRIEDLAAYFAAQIRAFHPSGPCIVTGFCAGGMTAFELGRQLERAGTPVSLVALFGRPVCVGVPVALRARLSAWSGSRPTRAR
jgi:thioesterase domain-containing protein